MTRFRSILPLALALALLPLPTRVAAQTPWDTHLKVGLSAGPDAVPAAIRKFHVDPRQHALGFGVAARAAVSLWGPAGVEARVGISSGDMLQVVNPNDPEYINTLELERSDMTPGPQAFGDLRLRLEAPSGVGPVATLGGGLMTENVRFIAGSIGHRWGAAHAFGVDLEVAAYDLRWQRIAYDVHVDDTGGPEEVVPTIEDVHVSYFRRWDLGVGLRFVYELALF